MGRDRCDDDDDRRPRRRRPSYADRGNVDDSNYDRPREKKNAAITFVAIINFVMGGLVLVCGMCGVLVEQVLSEFGQLAGLPGIGGSVAMSLLLVALILGWGLCALAAGIGLVHRTGWGRLLTLILGGFAASAGLLYLVAAILRLTMHGLVGGEQVVLFIVSLAGAFLLPGYCIWSYLVLLNPRHAAEFH